MSEIKHTALPWKFTPWHIEEGAASVRSPLGWAVCFTSSDADSEFIATACNAYYENQASLASHTSALAEKDAEIEDIRAQLVRMVDIAEDRLFEIGRIRSALEKLEGDSLDAMIEVIGEGPEFKRYNQGKSSMREWFLRRVNSMISGGSPDA